MTMPKKKRRDITVNGVLYHYNVSGYSTVIQNTVTDKLVTISKSPQDNVHPRDIEYWIKTKGV